MYIETGNAKSSFSQTEMEDGYKKIVTIMEVENGFIYQIEKYKCNEMGERTYPKEGEAKDHTIKTYISKDNPMKNLKEKPEEKKEEVKSDVIDTVGSFLNFKI